MYKNDSAVCKSWCYFENWTPSRIPGVKRICDLPDGGHAHRRIVRKVRSFVSGNEFADEYTPPYFSREFSYSKKERDIKARQLKSDSDRKTTALAPLVTQTLLKKNVSRFFDNKIFAYSKTEHGFEFRSYSPCGDEYKFEFAKYTAKYLCARYETSIKYNGEEIFRHDFAPEAGLNAETGLEHFMCNLEYDLEIFKNVLLPFIDRESAIELELAEQEKKTPRVKARSAVLASENALTDAVSRVSETMSMRYVLSRDMGADNAADMLISLIDEIDDINVPDKSGCTLLCRAIFQDIPQVVLHILKRSDTDVYLGCSGSSAGRTPLHFAVHRKPETVKLLLDYGADVNLTDAKGNTPLTEATVDVNPDVIRLLIEHGADPLIANNVGDNAFDIFVGVPKITELLNRSAII